MRTLLENSHAVVLGLDDGGIWNPKRGPRQRKVGHACCDASQRVRVLVVDRDSMTSDLLATALAQDKRIQAIAVRASELLSLMESKTHVVVIGADLNDRAKNGFDLARSVRQFHPTVSIVILLDQSTPDLVIGAFRSGASGVITRQQPVAEFLDCVERVRQGVIWAGKQETTLLLDSFRSLRLPTLSVNGESAPLTERELQVVRCAARGKTNKVIASELLISEHTVKNYLFRAFEKLGVSNRVELLFRLTGMSDVSSLVRE